MMVAIRLRRAGSKKRPFFRVVVTDSRAARDSSFVEILGHYNPRTKPARRQREHGTRGVLDQQGRAAVRFGADADRPAPDAVDRPAPSQRRRRQLTPAAEPQASTGGPQRSRERRPKRRRGAGEGADRHAGRRCRSSNRSIEARRSSSSTSPPANSDVSSASRGGRRLRCERWRRRRARRKARPSRSRFATAGRDT